MRVVCDIDHIELEGNHGSVPSVSATCSRCGHTTESFGQSESSVKRCLVLLREECPKDEKNFYVEDGV